jgi:hypothetical protein
MPSGNDSFGIDLDLHLIAEERLHAGQRAGGWMLLIDDTIACYTKRGQFVVVEPDYG